MSRKISILLYRGGDQTLDPPCKIMIVDENESQRQFLRENLVAAGYEIVEATTAEMALRSFVATSPDLVVTDWAMCGMTGPELCRWIRNRQSSHYIYVILLTSRTEKTDVAAALDAGADDFLIKPLSPAELRGRIAAGWRIVQIERELTRKNRLLAASVEELRGLQDAFDRDLTEARKLQQSLVRERHRQVGTSDISLLLQPAGHVGGDLVGFFPVSDRSVGCFALDVAGNGITSAMMTARLAGYLTGSSPEQNIALIPVPGGGYRARKPAELAQQLNRIVLSDIQTESYFTLAYAEIDLVSGQADLLQAGHPHPIILRADGSIEYLGSGGLPIGLIDDASFVTFPASLQLGDRLILISDGVTDALSDDCPRRSQTKLGCLLQDNRHLAGTDFLDSLYQSLKDLIGAEPKDDVSAVCFRFGG